MNVLTQPVLVLNRHWQPVGEVNGEIALCNLCKGAMCGIDTATMRALTWDQWLELPVRESDLSIRTMRGPVRVPRVVVAATYAGMPEKRPRFDRHGVGERDGYRCAYSGEYCKDGTQDHVKPRSRGGANNWENVVWARKDINHRKGDRTPEEAGLKLRRKPFKPLTVRACVRIQAKHPDWLPFVYRRDA